MAKDKLTPKQTKFVQGIVEGKSGTKAALDAYDVASPDTARSIASENLTKPSIRQALENAMMKAGITTEIIVAPVAEALNHEDLEMRLKGHDRAMKIVAPQKEGGGININFNQHVTDKREEYGI